MHFGICKNQHLWVTSKKVFSILSFQFSLFFKESGLWINRFYFIYRQKIWILTVYYYFIQLMFSNALLSSAWYMSLVILRCFRHTSLDNLLNLTDPIFVRYHETKLLDNLVVLSVRVVRVCLESHPIEPFTWCKLQAVTNKVEAVGSDLELPLDMILPPHDQFMQFNLCFSIEWIIPSYQ